MTRPSRALGARVVPIATAQQPASWHFVLFGAVRTKKNHGQIIKLPGGRMSLLPSPQWRAWCREMVMQAGVSYAWQIDEPLNIAALFYRERATGDAVGYYQGLADVLERIGCVTNDRHLVSWDGSRLLKDAQNPRVEITLTRYAAAGTSEVAA